MAGDIINPNPHKHLRGSFVGGGIPHNSVESAKMFKSAEGIGGLGIRCGAKIYDVLTLGGISRGSLMCKRWGNRQIYREERIIYMIIKLLVI